MLDKLTKLSIDLEKMGMSEEAAFLYQIISQAADEEETYSTVQ